MAALGLVAATPLQAARKGRAHGSHGTAKPATAAPNAAPAVAPTATAVDGYATALAKVKAGDISVDFKRLRRERAAAAGFAGGGWPEAKALFGKLDADPAAALAGAEAALADDWLNAEAHLLADIALTRLSRKDEGAPHRAFLVAFLRSITDGRDGRTAATAWNAVSVPEEYFALMLMGYSTEGQALVSGETAGGGPFDRMQVADRKSGEKGEIWFDIGSFYGKEFAPSTR